MARSKKLRILAVTAVLIAVAVVVPSLLRHRLTPEEDAVAGTWESPLIGGWITTVNLSQDRSCRVSWTDSAGNLDASRPPENGHWRVEAGQVVVDVRYGYGPCRSLADALGFTLWGNMWALAVEPNGLVFRNPSPVPLHRVTDNP
jgi:hypothetical protein